MPEQFGEKRHPATDRRRQKAREQGQIARSQDLASAILLLAALGVLWVFGRSVMARVASAMIYSLRNGDALDMSTTDASSLLVANGQLVLLIVAPVIGSMFACAVLAHMLQTGPMITPEKTVPKFENVNPIKGLQRLVALPSFMRFAFGIFKLIVVASVAGISVFRWKEQILVMGQMSVVDIGQLVVDVTFNTCLWVGLALLILAIFDFAFQKWKHERDLMMTEQEMRDELKEMEGDPHIKAQRRQVQKQLAMQRVNTDVPKADVVVTNPTELAIAIQYDAETMPAPIVVAKGAGLLAQRIRRIALEHGIAIVERKPLAQTLYKVVDVGKPIPMDQYQAVAEVLRYVYQLEGRRPPNAA